MVGLHWTPMFDYFMARFVLENRYQRDMCYDEIRLCVLDIKNHSKFNNLTKKEIAHKIMVVEIRVWAIGCYVPNRNWCRSEMQKEGWDSAKRAYGDPLPIIT